MDTRPKLERIHAPSDGRFLKWTNAPGSWGAFSPGELMELGAELQRAAVQYFSPLNPEAKHPTPPPMAPAQFARVLEFIRSDLDNEIERLSRGRHLISNDRREPTDEERHGYAAALRNIFPSLVSVLKENLHIDGEDDDSAVPGTVVNGAKLDYKRVHEEIDGAEGEAWRRANPARHFFPGRLRRLNALLAEIRDIRIGLQKSGHFTDETPRQWVETWREEWPPLVERLTTKRWFDLLDEIGKIDRKAKSDEEANCAVRVRHELNALRTIVSQRDDRWKRERAAMEVGRQVAA